LPRLGFTIGIQHVADHRESRRFRRGCGSGSVAYSSLELEMLPVARIIRGQTGNNVWLNS
jgi:hypothetical protein